MFRARHLCLTALLLVLTDVPLRGKAPSPAGEPPSGKEPTDAVVRIEVTSQEADYRSPWNAGRLEGGVGSGFVISVEKRGKRILTNAHVVSNARFITITREGAPHPSTARVEFIAHDCDLALLSVDDPSFLAGMPALEFGPVPRIESAVSVYGYPLGGERPSVTRGVVSRVDFEQYSHSGVDSHLVIQIDAAINPGNSGGPVLQEGKVVGVAFQGYSGVVAQNIGFMIPTPVISRFLRDLSKGAYTGYTDLSIVYRPLINPASRRALGLAQDDRGVLVTDVLEEGSAEGFLRKGDILLSVEGLPVASNGRVELEGQAMEMEEVVERKLDGEQVSFDLLREGKPLRVTFPLKGTRPFRMQSRAYDEKPRYLLHGGLLFQPLDRNLLEACGGGDLRLRWTFDEYVRKHLYREKPEVVVLSRVLADRVNKDCDGLRTGIVETVNGKAIRRLSDVREALHAGGRFDVITLAGQGAPIVLKHEEALKANPAIMERYSVPSPQYLEP